PFSDHCEPLAEGQDSLESLLQAVERDCTAARGKYVEFRPRTVYALPLAHLEPVQAFSFHALDLTPPLESVFRRFHRDSIQRKIPRATREGLPYEEGRSEALLQNFYPLHLRTRRRQQLPPHPRASFSNIVDCLGDNVKIRLASTNNQPIASIFTLSFKDVL